MRVCTTWMCIYISFSTIYFNITISRRFFYFCCVCTSMCRVCMCFCSIPICSFRCCNMYCRITCMCIKFCLICFLSDSFIQSSFYIFIFLNGSGNFFQSIHCFRSTTNNICNFFIRIFISICICGINSCLLCCRNRFICITGIIYIAKTNF